MSTYKVGDTVLVKTDIVESNNTPAFVRAMDMYRGTLVTITRAYINPNFQQRYFIAEDRSAFTWCDEFFEPIYAIDNSKDTYEYW